MFYSLITTLVIIAVANSSVLGLPATDWLTDRFVAAKTISFYFLQNAGGKVLRAAEEAKNIAAPQFSDFMRLSERLPESDNKPAAPVKLPAAPLFELSGASGVLTDARTFNFLFKKEEQKPMPIASITKLMATLVFLEHNPGWETVYQIKAEDKREGGRIYLFTGENVKVKDIFHSSLVASDNVAAIALVKSTGLSEEEFIAKMNEKARLLGLDNTYFTDPIGLGNANISTAAEVAKFAAIAFADKDISEATLVKKYEFNTLEGRKKIIYNTDDLLDIFPQNGVKITGGKTGYTEAAGYCFVGKFIDHSGHEIISAILNSESNEERFSETRDLVEWGYKNYQWGN